MDMVAIITAMAKDIMLTKVSENNGFMTQRSKNWIFQP